MKLSINLASRRHLNQRAMRLVLTSIILALLAVLLLQGNSYLKDRNTAATYQHHIDDLQQQLQGRMPQRLDPTTVSEQRKIYAQAENMLQRDAFRWTTLFDRMELLLPDGISLKSFSPDYLKKSLLIDGIARDLHQLQQLLDNLHNEDFYQVFLTNQGETSVDDGRGGETTALSFSISLGGVF